MADAPDFQRSTEQLEVRHLDVYFSGSVCHPGFVRRPCCQIKISVTRLEPVKRFRHLKFEQVAAARDRNIGKVLYLNARKLAPKQFPAFGRELR